MKLAIAALLAAGVLGACSDYAPTTGTLTLGPNHQYIAEAPGSGLPPQVEGPLLQACVNHASAAQKREWGNDFTFMRFDSSNLSVEKVGRYVGKRYIAARLNGQGAWWGYNDSGAGEYREVSFSCLLNKTGAIYTLVQVE